MTILEALRQTTISIKNWAENKFLNKNNIDSDLNSTSTNPVQNKAVSTEINNLKTQIDNIDVSKQIEDAIKDIDYPVDSVNGKTGAVILQASDVGALPDNTVIPSIDGLATETYVNEKVASLVDSAPETLDTLNELAAALGDDPNFATTVATQIGNLEAKVGNTSVADQIDVALDEATADDFGIYVQANEPAGAVEGDIWIDTANDPTAMDVDAPVQSVNGHTGNIIITASDIGAQPAGDYVTSVNGKTGAVTISALPTVSTSDNGKVLMVVNGAWQVVDLNMSIDANGVVSV